MGILINAIAKRIASGIAGRSVFAGAQQTRLTMDWAASILSADQEIWGNLRLLRARARAIVRDNPLGMQFTNLLSANVVGDKGITYRPTVRNNDGKLNKPMNDKIRAAWEEWCKQGNCTVDGKLSIIDVQDLLIRTWASDGEFLVRMVPGYKNKYRFALQLIDADQLDHQYNTALTTGQDNQKEIRMGVEVDEWGKPIAYHISKRHPADFGGTLQRERISADYIIHGFRPLRINQSRGIPVFHPVLMSMRMLDGYTEAELVAARTGAAKMGWFEYKDATGFEPPDPKNPTKITMDANPGVIDTLPPGMTFKDWNPEHPSSAFPNFVKSAQRWIASGLGVSYNGLANDLEGVNYSSMRSGLLIERDRWKQLQGWFASTLLQRIFDAWLDMALLSGALKLDSRDPSKFNSGVWQGRGWQWVDPLKDVQAAILAIDSNLETRQQNIGEQGGNFDDTVETLVEETKTLKAAGLYNPAAPLTAKEAVQTTQAGEEEGAGGAAKGSEKDGETRALEPLEFAHARATAAKVGHALNGTKKGGHR